MRHSEGYRRGMGIAGALAALALAVRGFQLLGDGSGRLLLLLAAAAIIAVLLRQFVYKD